MSSVSVVRWLNEEGIDLLEVSGGTYEQLRLLGYMGGQARRVKKARLTSR
ncbi:hypothetical protein [Marinobacter sp.]|nr:hypothetical protein [Marinobacter sp.]